MIFQPEANQHWIARHSDRPRQALLRALPPTRAFPKRQEIANQAELARRAQWRYELLCYSILKSGQSACS